MYTINVYRKKVELQNGATFFKSVTKVGDNWYSVRFAKEAKKALADFYVPRQIKLNDGDYFITLDKDKNGNVKKGKDGKPYRIIVITNYVSNDPLDLEKYTLDSLK